MAPRDLRRRPTARHAHAGEHLTLRLGYRPPYDLESMLGFLRGRALPGVEHVGDDSYARVIRSEEHTSELQSLMRISYAVFCLKKKKKRLTIYGMLVQRDDNCSEENEQRKTHITTKDPQVTTKQ